MVSAFPPRRSGALMNRIAQDIRFAWRSVLKNPVFSTIVVACIAISSQMSFSNWTGPFLLIALGTLGGAFLGTVVRVLMEGVILRNWERGK